MNTTDKPKRKTKEPGGSEGIVDLLLLAKSFVWEVDYPPEEVAQMLLRLNRPKRDSYYYYGDSQTAKVWKLKNYDQTYDFEIYNKLHDRMTYNVAIAQGTVVKDGGIEKTIIRG